MLEITLGVRRSRHEPLIFCEAADAGIARGTPVLLEIGGEAELAYVDLPMSLALAFPAGAVTGHVVAAGDDDPTVAAAIAARNAAALALVRSTLGCSLPVDNATWSLDGAWLTLSVPESALSEIGARVTELASAVKAAIRFQSTAESLPAASR